MKGQGASPNQETSAHDRPPVFLSSAKAALATAFGKSWLRNGAPTPVPTADAAPAAGGPIQGTSGSEIMTMPCSRFAAALLLAAVAACTQPPPAAMTVAQPPSAPPPAGMTVARACAADIDRLCPGVPPGQGRIKACMKAQFSQVSPGCFDAVMGAIAAEREPQ